MDWLLRMLELMGSTLELEGPLWSLVVWLAWIPLLVLSHELGHAGAALLLTRGAVGVVVGRPDRPTFTLGRVVFALSLWADSGFCVHEHPPRRARRSLMLILAAGPLASLALAIGLSAWALQVLPSSSTLAHVLITGASGAWWGLLVTALPLNYSASVGGGESDGRSLWRLLTGAPQSSRFVEPGSSSERPETRPAFVVALGGAALLALAVEVELAIALVGIVVLAWREQRGLAAPEA